MTWYIISALGITIIYLCFLLLVNKRKGKIEIKILKIKNDEVRAVFANFFFEIDYLSKKWTNKEQSAAMIDYLIRDKFDSVYVGIDDIDLIEMFKSISPVIEREARCEITGKKTKILVTNLTNWPKEVFAKT